jgi:asparagine synthase (glutamine-hydrolysing)
MSVQFGHWAFKEAGLDAQYLEKVNALIARYGSDRQRFYSDRNATISFHAFHTTRESRAEIQPHLSESGAAFTWDGRLDNRDELTALLGGRSVPDDGDVSVVAALFDRWGVQSLAKLIGDWALSIWIPGSKTLLLAKDFLGTRPLYYTCDHHRAIWCSVLDPLLLLAGTSLQIEEEYVAGWLSFFPAAHLSPFVGIYSVPASSYVSIRDGKPATTHRYWDFDPSKQIVYNDDRQYEEHFRTVFSRSVRRRLRSDLPVVAELSGGLDSSSIVCVSDILLAEGHGETPRLDTLSYYDDSEPNWNELPFLTLIEKNRGRTGCHIDVGNQCDISPVSERDFVATAPSAAVNPCARSSLQFRDCLLSQGNRVLLSGTGGDEVLGGVPTPTPELADLASRAEFRRFWTQLLAWALVKRKPLFKLAGEVARVFLPPELVGAEPQRKAAPWLTTRFSRRYQTVLRGYPARTQIVGPLPSFQAKVRTLDMLRRQFGCASLPFYPPYEIRYPYLDRDLFEFLLGIPREQLVRPRQRRSLMRRALTGIVPDQVLNRRRKAFLTRSPILALSAAWSSIESSVDPMVSHSLGIIDQQEFHNALQRAIHGADINLSQMLRTLTLELWLHQLTKLGLLKRSAILPSGNSTHGECRGWDKVKVAQGGES